MQCDFGPGHAPWLQRRLCGLGELLFGYQSMAAWSDKSSAQGPPYAPTYILLPKAKLFGLLFFFWGSPPHKQLLGWSGFRQVHIPPSSLIYAHICSSLLNSLEFPYLTFAVRLSSTSWHRHFIRLSCPYCSNCQIALSNSGSATSTNSAPSIAHTLSKIWCGSRHRSHAAGYNWARRLTSTP